MFVSRFDILSALVEDSLVQFQGAHTMQSMQDYYLQGIWEHYRRLRQFCRRPFGLRN